MSHFFSSELRIQPLRRFFALLLVGLFSFQSYAAEINIANKGAKPGKTFLNTSIIQSCIDEVAAKGGGYVIIPSDTFCSGTIQLRSNVFLKLEPGAVLYGSPNLADYIRFDGHRFDRYLYHLITAKNAHNTGLIGEGTIDGNGAAFWEPYLESEMPKWIKAKDPRVSRLIEFTNCKAVQIRNLKIQNSPEWTLHFFNCKEVLIDGIRIENHLFGPNADGIDLTGCQGVRISNCHIVTCDDGICLKTNPESDSCAQISVSNCIIKTSCAALKIGNESAKDFRQITFSNCVVYESSRAVAIYSEEGGMVEDVLIQNIVADNNAPLILTRPIHISLMQPAKGKKGGIRNVTISDFVCKTQGRIMLTSAPGSMIENLQIRNCRLEYPWIEDPYYLSDSARSAQYSPQNKTARKQRAAIVAENIKNLVLNHVQIHWPDGPVPKAWQWPRRIENGSRPREIKPSYRSHKECDLDVLYGSGLVGGYLWAPAQLSSNGNSKGIVLMGCSDFTVR